MTADRSGAARLPTWLLLTAAVAGEVAGTASLRLSEGLTRPVFTLGVVLLYGASIAIFGRVLGRGMSLGVAYGTITASGLVAATLLSAVAFDDRLSVVHVIGILVLGTGAVLLQVDRA
ncbi:QacE family quaternary ammonium compound efflux SMR transporter [Nocardioidaceae bacterium]|nr:QacE family quaternary ammonium compound efflux SMR transporter [Nocardioidaceae bacterium]